MTHTLLSSRALMLVCLAGSVSGAALAGRPLTVDDAGTNATGEGHVEVWATRADGVRSLNISPAYAVREGIELSATLSRETPDKTTTTALQAKFLLSPSLEKGCNLGLGVGVLRARTSGANENGSFINGIGSCNGMPLGNIHVTLGLVKPSKAAGTRTWGLALEREMGDLTPHVEYFGVEGSKPVVQVGLRGDVAAAVQLDGTVARSGDTTSYSLGFKLRF
jgi:hypothetical protein